MADEHVKVSRVTDNFGRIARDLHQALRYAKLSTLQMALFMEAEQLSWWAARPDGDALPFTMNLSGFARKYEFNRSGVRKAHKSLFDARVFIDLGDGRTLINKDYRLWLDPHGKPLLARHQVEACLGVANRTPKPKKSMHDMATPVARGGGYSSSQGVAPVVATPEHSSSHPPASPPHPPYRIVRVIEKPEDVRETPEDVCETSRPPGDAGAHARKAGAAHTHLGNGSPTRSPEDRAEVEQAIAILGADLRTEHVGMQLGRNHNLASLVGVHGWKWVRAARILLGPTVADSKRRSWPYYSAIAAGVDDAERDQPLPWEVDPRRAAHLQREAARKADLAAEKARRAAVKAKEGGKP